MATNRHNITTTVDRHNISILSSTVQHTQPVLRTVSSKWYSYTTLPLRTLQRAFKRRFKAIQGADPPTPLYRGGGSGANMPLLCRDCKLKMVFQVSLLCRWCKLKLTYQSLLSLWLSLYRYVYSYTVMAFGRLIAEVNFGY